MKLRFLMTTVLLAFFGIAHAQNTQWYGYAIGNFGGDSWSNQFISFDTQNPNSVQTISETLPQVNAATYVDGEVWFVTLSRSLCKAPFNAETQTIGQYETVVQVLDQYRLIIDMAYNPVNGKMYYLCQDSQYNSSLKCFDLASPSEVEVIGEFNVKFWTLAINNQGEAYGITFENGSLYQIDLANAATTLIGSTGKDVWYTQSMAFDLGTGLLYWAQLSSANDHGFYQVDTQTGAVTSICEIGTGGAQLTGLFMIPETTPEPVVDVIDFETGDFSQFSFNNTFDIPWEIFEEGSGNLCMRSGNKEQHSTSSIIEATCNYTEPGFIYFDGKCRGEGTSNIDDRCRFYIDGMMQFEYGNTGPVWNSYTFEVAAGSHTFRWEYTKDGNVNPEGDYFGVDNIKFATGSPCMLPTNLSVVTTTTNATISWNGYSSFYTLRFKDVSENEWTTIPGIAENSFILDLPYGTFEVEIQSDCDEGNWVSIVFTIAPEPTVVYEVFIEGFTEPVWGEHPDYDIEVDSTAPCTIEQVEWHRYGDIEDVIVGPEEFFDQEDVSYYLFIILSPKEGFVFYDNMSVFFNGDNSFFDFGTPIYNGFRVYSIDFHVTNPEGVGELTEESLTVWPNPAGDVLVLRGIEGENVSVYDNTGRLVLQGRYQGCLDISTLAPGIYVVNVEGHCVRFMKK